MEAKINVAEILKDKPQGTKLYDWLYNIDVELDTISTTDTETVVWCTNETDNNTTCHRGYSEFGTVRGCNDGLQILLPSKEMRDWHKFSWKKGDVLRHSEYPLTVIFESFEDDTYTSFKCKYCFDFESANKWLVSNSKCSTKHFYKVSDEEAKEFIKKVELNYNGKLKMETLEIEKSQPEFKDGDVLFVKCEKQDFIEIFNYSKKNGGLYDHASLNTATQNLDISGKYRIDKDEITEIRIATEGEKQQLFNALAKDGKAWDSEKKAIVDLKQKDELKPFDKVWVKDAPYGSWEPALFWKRVNVKDLHPYMVIGGKRYRFCEPYEGNEHFLND